MIIKDKTPLISVITICYNAAASIESTINSVIVQMNEDMEYLIVDGGSKDETNDIVEKYKQYLAVWISEPDNGIPDALNKAVKHAKGKYITFILAGDTSLQLPFQQLIDENADLVCFPVMVTGDVVQHPKVNQWLKIMNTIPHQGAFFKNTTNLKHDSRYRFYCDFALCQNYWANGLKIRLQPYPIVAFHGLDGATSDKKNFREVFTVVKNNYGRFYQALSFLYFKYDGLLNRLKLKTN